MRLDRRRLIAAAFGKKTYQQKIKALFGSSVIALWPLTDTSGTTMTDVSGNLRNGSYSGVALANALGPKGKMVGYWDGSVAYADAYSASLAGAFNGQEGSEIIWCKVSGVGVWTDGAARYAHYMAVNANNFVGMYRAVGNDDFGWTYRAAAGGLKTVTNTSMGSPTGWLLTGLTWSLSNGRVRAYLNGSQQGSDVALADTWSGALGVTNTLVGAASTTPTYVWRGWLAYAMVLNREATAPEMAQVYSLT